MRRTAVAACLLAVALAGPAGAGDRCCTSPYLDLIYQVLDAVQGPPPRVDGVRVVVTGAYSGVLVDGLEVAATCDAVAVGAVTTTVIDQCYLTSSSENTAVAMSANVATASFVERVDTLDFALCFHAYAIPLLDPLHTAEAGGCTVGLDLGGTGLASGSN